MRLIAENLSARRGEDFIFMNIFLQLNEGEALLLTGANGSGKSTLLRVLAGFLAPETGNVRVLDRNGSPLPSAAEACHYLGHRNAMKAELTVAENLSFWKTFLGDFEETPSMGIEEAADAVGLAGITHLPFGYLSAGQQRRFAMARLLSSHRPVWLLDEPTAALDDDADDMFAHLVSRHLAQGGIAVAATHRPLGIGPAQKLRMTGFSGVAVQW